MLLSSEALLVPSVGGPLTTSMTVTLVAVSRQLSLSTTLALNKLFCLAAYGAHKREGPADDVDDSNVNSCKLKYVPDDGRA